MTNTHHPQALTRRGNRWGNERRLGAATLRVLMVLAGLAFVSLSYASRLHGQANDPSEDAPPARSEGAPPTANESSVESPPAPSSVTIGAVLSIHNDIRDITKGSLERRIAEAREAGASVIIFDMDTPGGLVSTTIEINDLIRNLVDIKTVAWVNPDAYSGGSAIAIACDEIVMARSSRIGDAQVIFGGPGGVEAIPEALKPKVNTPVIDEFLTSAALNGYSEVLCEAFIIPEREVWWLENVETGEREFVFRAEKQKRMGGGSSLFEVLDDEEAEKASEWKLVESYFDPVLDRDIKAAQPVVRSDLLLQMSGGKAVAFGFAKGIVVDEGDLRERYGLTEVIYIGDTWSEAIAFWLTSAYVRGFLMLLMILGAYVEFHTPGVGVAGLVALICLMVVIGAPYLTGLASVWEIALIIIGFLLIALEIFVIPGVGVAGIAGLMFVMIGLLSTFVPDDPSRWFPIFIPSAESSLNLLKQGIVAISTSLVTSVAGMFLLGRFLPRSAAFAMFAPANPMPSEVQLEDPYQGTARVGDMGVAISTLRPAGKARFGSVVVDVVTQGDYLDTNARLEVIERRGNRVVVRSAK